MKKKLNLGKELSKNEQKKVLGGVRIYCSNGESFLAGPSCQGQAGYCPATGRGVMVACY